MKSIKKEKVLLAHIIATAIASLTIASFFISSLLAELFGSVDVIKTVKTAILYSLPIMLVAMPVLGISGQKLADGRKSPLVTRKTKRLKWVFINGMLLIILAIILYSLAMNNYFGRVFLSFQIIELSLGFINFILIALNIRTGLKLSGKIGVTKL